MRDPSWHISHGDGRVGNHKNSITRRVGRKNQTTLLHAFFEVFKPSKSSPPSFLLSRFSCRAPAPFTKYHPCRSTETMIHRPSRGPRIIDRDVIQYLFFFYKILGHFYYIMLWANNIYVTEQKDRPLLTLLNRHNCCPFFIRKGTGEWFISCGQEMGQFLGLRLLGQPGWFPHVGPKMWPKQDTASSLVSSYPHSFARSTITCSQSWFSISSVPRWKMARRRCFEVEKCPQIADLLSFSGIIGIIQASAIRHEKKWSMRIVKTWL